MIAAAGVVVVSAAFALYTLLRDYLGPAGASAVIAALFAVIFALVGVIALRRGASKGAKNKASARDSTAMGRVIDALRDRPVMAAGAAAAAGLIAWRNPQLVSTVLRALEPRADHARD